MKNFLLFLLFSLFLFAGCSLKSDKTIPTTPSFSHTGYIYPNKEIIVYPELKNLHTYNQSEGFILPITGKISQNTKIGQHILINNGSLIYSGLFSITLPYSFEKWEYSTGSMELLSLFNKTHNMSISIGNDPHSMERSDEQTKCKYTLGEFITSQQKINNGKTFYITTIRYPGSLIPTKDICFVHNHLTHRISFSDNNSFTTKSINSFRFLSQKTSKKTSSVGLHYTGNHILIPNATGMYSNIIISGHTFVYKNFFHINLPERLQFWQILQPSTNTVDLYFVDKIFHGFQMDDVSFLRFIIAPISSRKEPNAFETCKAIQGYHEPYPLIIHTGIYTTYHTYRSYDSFGYLRKQGDICFFDQYFVYNISVRLPKIIDTLDIINSFTFFN